MFYFQIPAVLLVLFPGLFLQTQTDIMILCYIVLVLRIACHESSFIQQVDCKKKKTDV